MVEIHSIFFSRKGNGMSTELKYTVKSKSIHSVESGFSSISPSNLGQISKSGTVLKSWERVDFKTVPDFEIWPRFDGEIEEKPDPTEWIDSDFTVLHKNDFSLCKAEKFISATQFELTEFLSAEESFTV